MSQITDWMRISSSHEDPKAMERDAREIAVIFLKVGCRVFLQCLPNHFLPADGRKMEQGYNV